MKQRIALTALIACMIMTAIAYAATSRTMKCRKDSCGMTAELTLGPTMMMGRITGYCVPCKNFVTLSWKERDMRTGKTGVEPAPKSLGKVWYASTGITLTLYSCPKCKGPFSEIKKHADVTHCPSCNDPGFKIDPNAPVMAIE